jgi:hypothetical protein
MFVRDNTNVCPSCGKTRTCDIYVGWYLPVGVRMVAECFHCMSLRTAVLSYDVMRALVLEAAKQLPRDDERAKFRRWSPRRSGAVKHSSVSSMFIQGEVQEKLLEHRSFLRLADAILRPSEHTLQSLRRALGQPLAS